MNKKYKFYKYPGSSLLVVFTSSSGLEIIFSFLVAIVKALEILLYCFNLADVTQLRSSFKFDTEISKCLRNKV